MFTYVNIFTLEDAFVRLQPTFVFTPVRKPFRHDVLWMILEATVL